MSELLSASMKTTLDKAEVYSLVSLGSSLTFLILCFPEAQGSAPGDPVKWQLLGFPLNFQPALALVVLYLLFCIPSLLADNMLIHVRDISARIKDEPLVTDLLMHPTVFTVSPLGYTLTTIGSSCFIIVGLWKLWYNGQYTLHILAWLIAVSFGLLGIGVFFRTHQVLGKLKRVDPLAATET